MRTNRRTALQLSGALVAGIAGCLDEGGGPDTSGGTATGRRDEGDTSPDHHSVTDVWVDNETDEGRTVSLTATADGSTVLEEQIELSPEGADGDTVTFEDPFADDTAYELVVESPELPRATYEWNGEFDDNEGVRILLKEMNFEFEAVQH